MVSKKTLAAAGIIAVLGVTGVVLATKGKTASGENASAKLTIGVRPTSMAKLRKLADQGILLQTGQVSLDFFGKITVLRGDPLPNVNIRVLNSSDNSQVGSGVNLGTPPKNQATSYLITAFVPEGPQVVHASAFLINVVGSVGVKTDDLPFSFEFPAGEITISL